MEYWQSQKRLRLLYIAVAVLQKKPELMVYNVQTKSPVGLQKSVVPKDSISGMLNVDEGLLMFET